MNEVMSVTRWPRVDLAKRAEGRDLARAEFGKRRDVPRRDAHVHVTGAIDFVALEARPRIGQHDGNAFRLDDRDTWTASSRMRSPGPTIHEIDHGQHNRYHR